MTEWQWKVIIALCRVVVAIIKENDLYISYNQINPIMEAIERDDESRMIRVEGKK